MQTVKVFFEDIAKFRWALPFVLLLAGYFIPQMRVPIGWPTTDILWASLALSFVVIAVWLVAEIITVVDRRTPVAALQRDDAVSLFVALALTYAAGELRQAGQLQWWFLLPWIGSMIDASLAGTLGINNAAQKPIVHGQS